MYRTTPDPLLVVPGEGLRGILVGCATPTEVLAAFGDDARVSRHDCGDVFQINYDYEDVDGDRHAPDRPLQHSRPSGFHFQFGLLEAIDVGVYQKELYTSGGVRIGSTKEEVLRVFGPDCQVLTSRGSRWTSSDDIETLRYLSLGIQLAVHHAGQVASFQIFQTRRRG